MGKKSVLVTGATGFLGQHTVAALRKDGWHVTQGVRQIPKGVSTGYIQLDLDNPSSISRFEKTVSFDAVVHLGAKIEMSGASLPEMYKPNVLATGCLAQLARDCAAHFIFASTGIVCGRSSERITSSSPTNPDTDYAYSKWLAEQLIGASGVDHCILRIAGIFGLNGPAHLGLNRAISGALQGEIPTVYGDGKALRNYTYVKDAASAIVEVVNKGILGRHVLAGDDAISIKQMLDLVCEVFLPDQVPKKADGPVSYDQIFESSKSLPRARRFPEALSDIKKDFFAGSLQEQN